MLSEPIQQLKQLINCLIDYQVDCETAEQSPGELIRLISNSNDPVNQKRALLFTLNLSRKHASRLGIVSSEDLIRTLIQLMDNKTGILAESHASSNRFDLNETDNEIVRSCLGCLYQLSNCRTGATTIIRFLTIPALIRLLKKEPEYISRYSLSILHNILTMIEASKPVARQYRAVEILCLDHLNSRRWHTQNDLQKLSLVVDSIYCLAFNEHETKLTILECGSPPILIDIMRQTNYEKLLFVTSRLLKILSVCNKNKPTIVINNGLQAIAHHLDSQSNKLMMSCLWTIRNLSDQAFHLTDIDFLINRLTQLLANPDINISTCACGCLCNFTCQNEHNKRILVRFEGVEALCSTLSRSLDHDEITEPIVCCLRHVTHRNEAATEAQALCQQYNGVRNIAKLLHGMHQKYADLTSAGMDIFFKQVRLSLIGAADSTLTGQGFSWPLLKACLGLVRNLALFESNRIMMRDLGLVPVICNTLLLSYSGAQALERQRFSTTSISSELSYVDGVSLEDMIELSLAAMQAFTMDPNSSTIIMKTPHVIQITVQILDSESEYLQRASTGLLCELARDAGSAKFIEEQGPISRLTQLLHSNDEAVSSYSAACLYRMAQDKPVEYRQRLVEQLESSLQDAGNWNGEMEPIELADNRDPYYQYNALKPDYSNDYNEFSNHPDAVSSFNNRGGRISNSQFNSGRNESSFGWASDRSRQANMENYFNDADSFQMASTRRTPQSSRPNLIY